MEFLSFSWAKYLCFACCCIILVGSCSKEPLDIRDVPFEQLESSYYKLAPNTIELSANVSTTQVISKDEISIHFSKSEFIESIESGDIIVSSMDTPQSEFICRKVIEVNDAGGSINFVTERATIVEAYDSFYFDSSKQNLVKIREETKDITDLFNSVESLIDSGLKSIIGAIVEGGDVVFNAELDGSIELIAIHPNDFFRETYAGKLTAQDILDDNNNNIWNIVELELGINPNNQMDVMELGFVDGV